MWLYVFESFARDLSGLLQNYDWCRQAVLRYLDRHVVGLNPTIDVISIIYNCYVIHVQTDR